MTTPITRQFRVAAAPRLLLLLALVALGALSTGAVAAPLQTSRDLAGTWTGSAGDSMVLQQSGLSVTWQAHAQDGRTWYHDFSGQINGDFVSGTFTDRPGYVVHQTGQVSMHIIDDCHMDFASASVPFITESWAKTPCAPPAPPATASYLWGARVSSVGDPSAVLSSQSITGSGGSAVITQGGATTSHTAGGSFRVVWRYRRPAGKARTLSLAVVGPASPVVARPGGGGNLSLRVRVRHSDFSGCDTRDYGIVTLVDRAGAGQDSLVLSVCHSKTRYVDGGPHQTRVFTLVGRRR